MKKIEETFKKIQADDSLKERIIAKVSEGGKVSGADLSQAQTHSAHKKTHNKPYRAKRHFGWQRITAAAVSFVLILSLTLTLALQPWANNGNIGGGGNNNGGGGGGGGNNNGNIGGGNIAGVLAPVETSKDKIIELIESDVYGEIEAGEGSGGDVPAGVPGASSKEDEIDYATTNVQHEGVDEGDIIKVDGGYIYTLSRLGLLIVNAGDKMSISYQESYENFYPDELYIFGNKLVVIGGEYSAFVYDCYDIGIEPVPYYGYRTNTKIIIYDLGNRADVKLSSQYSVSGYFKTSRLIDGRLIVSINYDIKSYDASSYFPKINNAVIDAKYIHLYESGCYRSYMMLLSLDLNSYKLDYAAHLGLRSNRWSAVDYFSKDNLYSFVNVNEYVQEGNNKYSWHTSCFIIKINLGTLMHAASKKIEGTVNDRYWADEYEGNLRVVSFVQKSGSVRTQKHTNVYVLNSELETLGSITDIAPGENIYSARFKGNAGSVVTFLEIDPLFTLDLSNLQNPTISRGLKEAGVSDYLQYLSDDVILGLGRNTVTQNGTIQFAGMKVALYDNTGEDAVNINTINIGSGYAYSEALYEPKAILNDTAKNMFSFAVTMQGGGLSLEGQGLMVFEYNLNAANNADKLIKKGFLTNVGQNTTYASWADYYYDYFSYVKRGVRIGDKLYTVSDRYITSYNLNTLKFIQRLELTVDACYFTHKWTAWTTTKSRNCTESGEEMRHCQTCGKEERYTLSAYGHGFNGWEIETMPNAAGGGTESRACYRCGHKETRSLVNTVGINGFVLVLNGEGTEYHVRTYKGSSAAIEIPDSFNGVPVTEISPYAFNNSSIKSVNIPKNIVRIANDAFSSSGNLQSVTFEEGSKLKIIGSYAFFNCSNLGSVVIPSGVETIGSSAFYSCRKLKGVYIPESVTNIGNSAFSYVPSLESLTVASGNQTYKSDGNCIIEISTNTLIVGCNSSVIPDYVTAIGDSAFHGSEIISISIPKNVEHIYSYAFEICLSLTSVTFEEGSTLKSIGYRAFADCHNIESFEINKNVELIENYAFEGWWGTQTIYVYGAEDEYAAMVKLGAYWREGCYAVVRYFE